MLKWFRVVPTLPGCLDVGVGVHNCLVIGKSSAIDRDVISRTKTERVSHGDDV